MRRKTVSKVLVAVLLVSLLTGCGSKSYSGDYNSTVGAPSYDGMVANSSKTEGFGISGLFDNNKSEQSYVDYDYAGDNIPESGEHGASDNDIPSGESQDGAIIQKDMLVYRGDIDITTKDYANAMAGVQELFKAYDCFIEYSREYSNYRYYDDTDLMTYEATIRVNSKDYESFMNGVSNLGVVSSKSSNVRNMNMEYSDTVTALRIQQARLDRYLERLETERDNEIALQLENQIANIQIELSQLESRKNLIETDVAYSYVDLAIREVKAYSSQVRHDDPLHVRVWAEIVNTYYEFTEFLVDVLFFFIHAFPYLVILGLACLIIFKKFKLHTKLQKIRRKKHKKDDESKPSGE